MKNLRYESIRENVAFGGRVFAKNVTMTIITGFIDWGILSAKSVDTEQLYGAVL